MEKQYSVILQEQLKRFREERQYTQEYVANYLKVSRTTYTNYENATRLPDVFTLDRLARLYNISVEAFLYPPKLYNTFKELHNLSYDHGKIPDIALADIEKELIYLFRDMDKIAQEEIIYLSKYKVKDRK